MIYSLRFTFITFIAAFLAGPSVIAQPSALQQLSLVDSAQYDSGIPTPRQIVGHAVGTVHTRTDQVIQYFTALDAVSERVTVDTTSFSHEGRALIHAVVTSTENMKNLAAIQHNNLELMWSPASVTRSDLDSMPVIVYLAYSIHGDEASGTEAALLLLYHLAADQSPETQALLQKMVIIIDPMLNPDGRDRFVNWVNAYRSSGQEGDIQDMEHNQPWPRGRTNHFLHDLNRDWLLAQHPETQGRLKLFHDWQPQLLVDVHEMGRNATYFFQPGVPSRNNPHSPENVFTLTKRLAPFFAKNLDRTGGLYYTGERFDDFYYGKGSTYPDINGAVGILFEQASSRSLLTDSDFGALSYEKTIQQQFLTSLGALEGARSLRLDLLQHQRNFYQTIPAFVRAQPVKAWIVDRTKHPLRVQAFLDVLNYHRIRAYDLIKPLSVKQTVYRPGESLLLPLNQPQGRLLQAIMETVTEFSDSIFYDVSAWTFPAAFGLSADPVTRAVDRHRGERISDLPIPFSAPDDTAQYAYILTWDRFTAPAALYQILRSDHYARVALQPFTIPLANGTEHTFQRGSIVIPVKKRDGSPSQIHDMMDHLSREYRVNIYPVHSGFSTSGPTLGSPNMAVLTTPVIALLAGDGTSSYSVGEIWHLLNKKMDMPLALLQTSRLSADQLTPYTTLIMPHGWYSNLDSNKVQIIKAWVRKGGTLIATEGSVKKLLKRNFIAEEIIDIPNDTVQIAYDKADARRGARYIGGAIFRATADTTHPLVFGLPSTTLLFRKSTLFLKPSKTQTGNVLIYEKKPLYSGYISRDNETLLAGSAALIARTLGQGHVILMTDPPFFRSFWYGTAPILTNGIFFGSIY